VFFPRCIAVLSGLSVGPTVTAEDDLRDHQTLDRDRLRFRGDWFSCASFIADLADQVEQRCRASGPFRNLVLQDIVVDQLGRPALADSATIGNSFGAGLAHLPPERIDGEPSSAADSSGHVYSIGVIFYTLLCGRAPFSSTDSAELTRQIKADLPQPPRQLIHGVPAEAESICLKALQKDKTARYATPQALASDLRKLISTTEDSVTSDSVSTSVNPKQHSGVAQRLLAVTVCESCVEVDDSTGEPVELLVQSVMAERLGLSRVHVIGKRIFVDSGVVEAGIVEDERVASLLSDIAICLTALRDRISTSGSDLRLDMKVHFVVCREAAFEEVRPDRMQFTATRLHAQIDGTSIRPTVDTRATLRRWLAPSNTDDTELQATFVISGLVGENLTIDGTGFVGREPQLGILSSRWMQSLEGMGQVVLLIGEEGSGKSRLLSEFVTRVSHADTAMTCITVTCRPANRGVAYACFAETCRELVVSPGVTEVDNGEAATHSNESIAGTSITVPALDDLSARFAEEKAVVSTAEKVHVADAMLNWLRSIAKDSPVIFAVEDIQWADPATLEFLQSIVAHGPNDRILTVLTCRSNFETPWGSHPNQSQIAIRSLSRRDIGEILQAGGEEPSDEFVKRVKKVTKGIPSLVEGVRDGTIPVKKKGATWHES